MSAQPNGPDFGALIQSLLPTLDDSPIQFAVMPVTGPKGQRVLLVFSTPTGTMAFLVQPDSAVGMSAQIADAARQAQSGLILPGGGLVQARVQQ